MLIVHPSYIDQSPHARWALLAQALWGGPLTTPEIVMTSLILIAGMRGTGKSTFLAQNAERATTIAA